MPTRHGKPNYAVLGISTALLMTLAVVLSVSWGESVLASVLAMVGALIAMALIGIDARRISGATSDRH